MTLQETKTKIEMMLAKGVRPDMPCFLLHGTDPSAPTVMRVWATLTSDVYRNTPSYLGKHAKFLKAYADSREMESWQEEHGTKIPD